MRPAENIDKLIKKLHLKASAELDERVHSGISSALGESEKQPSAASQPNLWRIIMKSKMTKLAAAAAIIVIAAVSIAFLGELTTSAYALDQTIKANHTVRYLHVKYTDASHDDPKEFWIECDELGQIRNARWHMPEWDSPEDGAKIGVWKEDRIEIWLKKKNFLFIARDRTAAAKMLELVQERDPRLAVERLNEQKEQGRVKIEIDQPSDKAEPIVVTATYLPESTSANKREVLFVDQATKLVTAIEFYQLRDGEYEYVGVQEYYDYNQPIDAEMFVLDNEVPAGVTRIDQIVQEVGLAQGTLTDDEIAMEVVRQFFKALIARDYAKAGRLLEGMPADKMEQGFGHIKFLRIVSIGDAGPHPIPETRGLVVPCTVEIEKDGEISEWKLDSLGVREVFNQPGRWTIFGGI